MRTLLRRARKRPLSAALAALAALAAIYVAAYPLFVAHYPPLTDLPFHAATISVLRHYADAAYRFREQFTVDFGEMPYWTMHVLGALFAFFMPVVWATKLVTAVMLLLLPGGLAVFFHGLKKSPLLGLLGLPLVWSPLTHWGFINFVGAIGLFAATVGFTLLVLDRPTPRRQLYLAVSLVLVFLTHIFRFPFALAAVVGTAVVMYPATRRWTPLLLPVLPAILLTLIWKTIRGDAPSTPLSELGPIKLHFERLAEVPTALVNGLTSPAEIELAGRTVKLTALALLAAAVIRAAKRRPWERSDKEAWWALCATVLPICIGGAFLAMYLWLPIKLGSWWPVYPREIVPAVLMGLGLAPDLPKSLLLRLPILAAIAAGAIGQASLVADSYAAFDASTQDFRRITRHIPMAPRLGYLIYDHHHPSFRVAPFLHLPAWVQAEKGGWVSFHFVSWNPWPIRYRKNSPAVPPPTPLQFEWQAHRFDLATRGKFFDWFLVRKIGSPDPRFAREPSLRLVDHVGAWWLYQRDPAPPR